MIQLPASNADVLAGAILPALDYLLRSELVPEMDSPQARCMLLAIGRQESGFSTRHQVGGPAHGLWQFERNGVLAVMHHTATAQCVFRVCRDFGIQYGSSALYEAIAADDVLACILARLLLWTDPRPLPDVGDAMEAWNLYERCWRPGKPNYSRWRSTAYPQALSAIRVENA